MNSHKLNKSAAVYARKLTVIIWNTVVKNVPYKNLEGYLYLDQKRKLGLVKRINNQIEKCDLTPEEIDFNNSLIIRPNF